MIFHGSGRSLAGSEAVNLIVHDHIGEIEIAPHSVDKMRDADSVAVAITAGDDDL